MNPEQALQAFMELGAARMIPMHYGTFRLSYEPVTEPPRRLLERASEMGILDRVQVLTEGQPVVF
jgi:L-ascorbate metabolism protein UlaG (beta-lactamase superfamily)